MGQNTMDGVAHDGPFFLDVVAVFSGVVRGKRTQFLAVGHIELYLLEKDK